jgi:hypothetical protein
MMALCHLPKRLSLLTCNTNLSVMKQVNRRNFLRIAGAGAAAAAVAPVLKAAAPAEYAFQQTEKPKTNVEDSFKVPRSASSMPGVYPGRVVSVTDSRAVADNVIAEQVVYDMLARSMMALTGEKKLKKAWLRFVSRKDRIGLKVNPVAGKSLSTSIEITKAIIRQLEESGIKRSQLTIWDRRNFDLKEAGFTPDNFPGINIAGTEYIDEKGLYYDADGILYGEKRIDKNWSYHADIEGEYDSYTIPYMINGGKDSYFSRIVTQDLDKIINVPILKNAGNTVTLALKNLAYGTVSNTGRLHQIWHESCAEVNAFAPLRDKVVLNIVDGIKGCFNGGPGANPQFFFNFNTIIAGSDPVAVDRVGYEMVLNKRIAEGIQKEGNPTALNFMLMAEKLQLGVADIKKINHEQITLG